MEQGITILIGKLADGYDDTPASPKTISFQVSFGLLLHRRGGGGDHRGTDQWLGGITSVLWLGRGPLWHQPMAGRGYYNSWLPPAAAPAPHPHHPLPASPYGYPRLPLALPCPSAVPFQGPHLFWYSVPTSFTAPNHLPAPSLFLSCRNHFPPRTNILHFLSSLETRVNPN